MALLSAKSPYPTSQYAATYRVPAREHHGFFASPTESEFSEHYESSSSIKNWDEDRVAEWLRSINCSAYVSIFAENNITGAVLIELDRSALRELGVKRVGDQIRISTLAKKFRETDTKKSSKATKNRQSLASLDNPQFTPPSSASPKPSHASRFNHGNRDQSKRMSRQITDYNHSNATLQYSGSSIKTSNSSRPSSPYIEVERPQQARQRGYGAMSPQKEQNQQPNSAASVRTPASSTDNILTSRYAAPPRSATIQSETPRDPRFAHNRGLSTDGASTSSILPIDKPLIRVIFDTGRTSVVNIDRCVAVEEVMLKTLRKGQFNEAHVKNYCFYVLDGIEPNPALCRRINDAEVMRICSDKTRVERNRLILRKIHQGEPDEDQLKTAASIAAQIQNQQSSNAIIPVSTRSQIKIEKITGESLAPLSYPQSPASAKERERHIFAAQEDLQRPQDVPLPRARPMKEHFGGRPPSELIASDLSTYFPDFEKEAIDKTVRMSVRRSRRISRATSRLSVMSNMSGISVASSLDTPPVPALPTINDPWLRELPKANVRPLSVLQLGQRGGIRDSIASSMLEPLDEESPLESDSRKSFGAFHNDSNVHVTDPDGHTTYYDDARSSLANSSLDGDGPLDSLNKRLSQLVQEDSEDEDEELTEYLEDNSWDNFKYMKGALIGQGSFGSVYLALHAVTGELMAVKQVEMPSTHGSALDAKKNTMVEALKHEIDLLRELKHDNIVQYLGSNREDTHLNIFLEYVPGGSVAKMLVNYGALGESLVANFVRQILTGLEYLHSKDIIHRDIKGANILIDHRGAVKISDFGISKRVEASSILGAGPTKKGNRVSLQGSVFWMAPEVVKQTAYTRKADIWSLGCLIVEMLTGTHPHPNCTQMQAIFKIGGLSEQARPTVPDNASAELRAFLDSTFDIEHERRPEASELLSSPWMAKDWVDAKK
ncbi:MAP kinase-like protein [Microthyrium microscopicum]|uniref:mitogen-activated protein kinase kinase kinase n=1 Tax=Microthyrium microscopicum TaxID=703497 RepID=A0A6A6U587_9PEZI|nr:MAP kinase-like protein [Microthyrium microscopicum]